ncbi:hypothetical protein ES703_48129 [subsurface metagenome]
MAVITPTGISDGAMTVRARRSAIMTKAPPPSAAAGRSRRWSGPKLNRMAWGTTSPTKPIKPLIETAAAVSIEPKPRITILSLSTFTPT